MSVVIYIARVIADEGRYTATFPDFPGLSLQRDNIPLLIQASRERLLQALQLHEAEHGEWPTPTPIETLGGKDAPSDQLLLAVDVQVDDTPIRVNISLGEHLLKRLDEAAETESMTRSGYIAAAVRQRLKRNAGKPLIDDAASQRLYDEVVAVGRRVNDTFGPDSVIGKTLTDLDNRALEGLRKLADGVGAAMQFKPRDPSAPYGTTSSAGGETSASGATDHPDPRDETASPDGREQQGERS